MGMVVRYKAFFFCYCPVLLFAHTIEDKISSLSDSSDISTMSANISLDVLHEDLTTLREELKDYYAQARKLLEEKADEQEFSLLLERVQILREQLSNREEKWRVHHTVRANKDEENCAFWDLEETTLSQLIVEFGSGDYLYIIPPDLANMKLHLHSNLLVPKESWNALIEVVLQQNGIGYKQPNPFARQLYVLKQDLTAVELITADVRSLDMVDANTRMIYIFAPQIEHLKPTFYFFERFRDPKATFVYQVGQKIAIVAARDEVQKLLTLYKNVWETSNDKVTRVVASTKIHVDEVIKLLKAYFGSLNDPNRTLITKGGCELTALPFRKDGGVILVGPRDLVDRAERLIQETELQVKNPQEMTVYWYNCRHSDPLDLSEVLQKVYHSLLTSSLEGGEKISRQGAVDIDIDNFDGSLIGEDFDDAGVIDCRTCSTGPMPSNAGLLSSQTKTSQSNNFIPYRKTGSILMVVRRDVLDKIKEVVRKLDVPKKMVEIEVLLCERRLLDRNRSGLNLLKIGTNAAQTSAGGAAYDASSSTGMKGLFEFFLSHTKHGSVPAFDVAYNFLMSQEDIRITASPSLVTINQTPATISITDEISINNGAAPVDFNKGVVFEKSYSRAQFGITLVMTPTIHDPDIEDTDGKTFVTLENNVTFDTIKSDENDRPNVHKRHIENQVRILDGQTVIIGGLKRKTGDDRAEKIPFLGEIPGLGKLFGTSVLTNETTEMFIFITPRVIVDPGEDLVKRRQEALMRRPGDVPSFLARLKTARKTEKMRIFEKSFNLVFGDANNAPTYF